MGGYVIEGWFLALIIMALVGAALAAVLAWSEAKRHRATAARLEQQARAQGQAFNTQAHAQHRNASEAVEAATTHARAADARAAAETDAKARSLQEAGLLRRELTTTRGALVETQAELAATTMQVGEYAAAHAKGTRDSEVLNRELTKVRTTLAATQQYLAAADAQVNEYAKLLKSNERELDRAVAKMEQLQGGMAAAKEFASSVKEDRKASARLTADQEKAWTAERKRYESALKLAKDDVAIKHEAGQVVADRFVKDTARRAENDVTSSNLHTVKARVHKVIAFCDSKGFITHPARAVEIDATLLSAFEEAVRRESAREEQRAVKEKIREEMRAERERQKEMERLEQEEARIQIALERALLEAKGEHDAEVERLRALLAEAERKAERAKSQAQLTKAGFVYVISNIGSFGVGVFKVGMTRRLEPMDRVIELGDASVPFPFDVHMMIACDDAPALETALHKALNDHRLNKVNLRKEFFRVSIDAVAELVERHHGKIEYRATPEALEFHETALMNRRGEAPVYDPILDEAPEDGDAAAATV